MTAKSTHIEQRTRKEVAAIKMKTFAAVIAALVLLEGACGDPAVVADCKYDCNSKANTGNKCNRDGTCDCVLGFGGKYCTCEALCSGEFGSCNDDPEGTCNCTADWKGRNCNCPSSCPDFFPKNPWRCVTGDTKEERGCLCKEDNLPWMENKVCCPRYCTGPLMYCTSKPQDGVCYCSTANPKPRIAYGSDPSEYRCCEPWCKESQGICVCRPDGCFVKLTGLRATKDSDCRAPAPILPCKTHDSWQECSLVHWQGRCQCDPVKGCRCKCWYGWAGGEGTYDSPGWEGGAKALHSLHCRHRCDWTQNIQPAYCSKCVDVPCPECSPFASRKCSGTA